MEKDSGRYRRRQALKVLGASGFSALAGCAGTGGDGGGNGETEVGDTEAGGTATSGNSEWPDYSGMEFTFIIDEASDPAREYFNGLADGFEEATGAVMDPVFEGIGGGTDRLTQMVQAGDAPELAYGDMGDGVLWYENDLTEPVTEAVENTSEVLGEPRDQAKLQFDGDYYLFPSRNDHASWWYRSDVSETAPEDWDSLLEYSQEVYEADNELTGTLIPTSTDDSACRAHHYCFALSNGATMCQMQDGEIVSGFQGDNGQKWIETVEYLNELYQYSDTPTSDASWSELQNAIQNGTSAQAWYAGVRPKNQCGFNERSFAADVERAPVDGIPGPSNRLRTGNDHLLVLQSENSEVAKTFLEWWHSDLERYADMFQIFSPVQNVPAWIDVAEEDYFRESVREAATQDVGEGVWTDGQLDDYFSSNMNGTNYALELGEPNPYAGTAATSGVIESFVAEVLVQEVEPEQALQNAHEQLSGVLGEAKQR